MKKIFIEYNTFRSDIIMQKQGYEDEKLVIIEDDVWIGRELLYYRKLQ